MANRNTFLFLMLLVLCACGGESPVDKAARIASTERLRQHTEAIAHDSCQGRKPFTPGADRAVGYIAGQMRALGLTPFDGDSYLQSVKLIAARTEASPEMTLKTPKGTTRLRKLEDFTAFSARIEPTIEIDDAQLVFAGYGIVAPEYGKNDYAGIENPGDKVAVVLVNDPGLDGGDPDYFSGDIMTYYGRWRYKFEEAARQGLKGALIIHDTRGAGYPWSVVQASAKSKMYVDDGNDDYHCPLNGWIQQEAARRLLADNGYDLDQLRAIARRADFRMLIASTTKIMTALVVLENCALASTVSVSMTNRFERDESPNLIGYIPGSEPTDESVVYLGHWDHLGHGAPIDGDSIINGATDNAVAVAWMLEIARCFQSLDVKPRRNIVFLSCSAPNTTWPTRSSRSRRWPP